MIDLLVREFGDKVGGKTFIYLARTYALQDHHDRIHTDNLRLKDVYSATTADSNVYGGALV